MDTLVYLYRKHSLQHTLVPFVEECQKKDYRLVRIGMSQDAITLLEEGVLPKEYYRNQNQVPLIGLTARIKIFHRKNPSDSANAGERIGKFFRIYSRVFRKKIRKRTQETTAYFKNQLLQDITRHWGDELTTYCICESPMSCFNGWRFSEFRETQWVERLLADLTLPHFLVLGSHFNLREILFLHARRMKSLKICVAQQEYSEEIEDIVEDLYEEYGLAAALQVLEGQNPYRNAKRQMSVSCNVLDFTEETAVNHRMVPDGSVWYDLSANEEKRRQLQERNAEICYKSLTVP